MIPWHAFIHNVHLFNTKITTLINLNRKTTENLTVNSTKSNIVVMGSVASRLLISRLISVEFDQRLHSPLRIGRQLILDVLGNSRGNLHRENSIDQPGPKSTIICNFLQLSTLSLKF
jgi:hypothetical protein